MIVVVQSYIWVLYANPLVLWAEVTIPHLLCVAASVYTTGPLCQSTDLGVCYHSV